MEIFKRRHELHDFKLTPIEVICEAAETKVNLLKNIPKGERYASQVNTDNCYTVTQRPGSNIR